MQSSRNTPAYRTKETRERRGQRAANRHQEEVAAAAPHPTQNPRANTARYAGPVHPLLMASPELSIPSAEPFPYAMPPSGRVALLMIDWQRDFLEEGGFGHALGNDVSTLRRGLGPAAAVLAAARACGVPIVHTLEAHQPDLGDLPAAKLRRCAAIGKALEADPARGRLLVAGEPGNAIVEEVAPLADELVLHKPGKGAFCGTALHDELRSRGVTHLIVTGVTTEVCVQSTLREANDRGYDCLVVSDATESYFPSFKQATLEMVVAQGAIVGWSAASAAVLAALRAHAPPPAPPPPLPPAPALASISAGRGELSHLLPAGPPPGERLLRQGALPRRRAQRQRRLLPLLHAAARLRRRERHLQRAAGRAPAGGRPRANVHVRRVQYR